MGGALRACFLTSGLPAAGDPAGDLLRALASRAGVEVTIALTDGAPPGATELAFGDGRAVPVAAASGFGEPFDIAVATSWETTAQLFAVPASRYALWTDGLAFRRMASWQAERFAAQLAYDLPVDFIATGTWLGTALGELRPDARCVVVPRPIQVPGTQVPGTSAAGEVPGTSGLRVVVDDRHAAEPSSSDERAAVAEAVAAGAALDVVHLDVADDAAARAAKLAGADVVLMLSSVDGVLGAPLEGFAAGATCLVAPAADAHDLVIHDENGLVADPDDVRGTARWLETLARDRKLLARLREGARATVAGWPTPDEVLGALAAGLEKLVAEEPPASSRWPVRLMGDAIGGAAVFRQELAALTAEVHRLQGDQAYRTAVAVREKWRGARIGPLRRIAGPLLRRVRSRVG